MRKPKYRFLFASLLGLVSLDSSTIYIFAIVIEFELSQ